MHNYIKQNISIKPLPLMLHRLKLRNMSEIRHPVCSTYKADEISANTFIMDSSTVQAWSSCSPTFVVAGFMKSGTTYLFDLLTQHPQVLKALRGVSFKETGCYLPDEMRPKRKHLRMQCFPFVEPDDPFIFGDGTVYYGLRKETPYFLKR